MEAKFLAGALSFLSIFLAIYAQSLGDFEHFDSEASTEFEIEPAVIYYGDSNVNIGEPFKISCIIPITDKIHWLKDGEPITRHNLRHGRDEHAYTLEESEIEESDALEPNYDNKENQLKFFSIRNPLVLSCGVKGNASLDKITWYKNDTAVQDVPLLKGRYRLIPAEGKFIIDKTDRNDDGLYHCKYENLKKDIKVVARLVVRVPSNSGVVEGEKLSVICSVVGTDPILSWSYGNLTLTNSTGRYILKPDDNNVQNAVLSIENISLDDRGEYKCSGRNDATEFGVTDLDKLAVSDVTTVRVKGKLAALWPFLGICAEVLILCLIILIYEKRRNKSELEESDTDPQEQ